MKNFLWINCIRHHCIAVIWNPIFVYNVMEFFIVAYSVPLTGCVCSLLLWNPHMKSSVFLWDIFLFWCTFLGLHYLWLPRIAAFRDYLTTQSLQNRSDVCVCFWNWSGSSVSLCWIYQELIALFFLFLLFKLICLQNQVNTLILVSSSVTHVTLMWLSLPGGGKQGGS